MSQALDPTYTDWTVVDVANRFGALPLSRLRCDPPPGQATEQDVIEIHDREDRLYELIDGTLLEKALGYYESFLGIRLARLLGDFAEQHRLGIVAGEAGMMRLTPGQVRIPDVSFVSWDKLPDRKVPREPIPDLVPDLAVEVASESNTAEEMRRKLDDYFASGVRLVWYVFPKTQTVEVYTSPKDVLTVGRDQVLDGRDVVRRFALPLERPFAEEAGG